MNKHLIIGNLGQDPEIRYTPTGTAVANLSVATTERWRDKQSGERKEKTEWHRVVLWGKLAEIAEKYLHKGDKVLIEGKVETRKWEDKDGNTRYTTETIGRELEMLGSPNREQPRQQASEAPAANTAPPAEDFEDDIPF